MRSGLRALIMQSFWSEVLFFHSWGNISFSGHSDSTSFFQRLAEPSMSRSRFLNSSIEHRDWWWAEGKVGGRKKEKVLYFWKVLLQRDQRCVLKFLTTRGTFHGTQQKWEHKFAKKKVEVEKKKNKEKKRVLIVPRAYINKIYSNGNAEYTEFSFFNNRPGGIAEYTFAASPANTWCTSWQSPYPICERRCVTQQGVSPGCRPLINIHTLLYCVQTVQTWTGLTLSQTGLYWKVDVYAISLVCDYQPHIITQLVGWKKAVWYGLVYVFTIYLCYTRGGSSREYSTLKL